MVASAGGEKKTLARGIRLPTRARPAVSADRKWVAFAYDDPTKARNIMVVAVDGSKTVEISTTFEACGDPALGLQGGRVMLAYTALPEKGADWRFLYVEDITDRM